MRPAIRLGLFTLFLRALVAQSQPDIATILNRVSQTYSAATQYEFVANLRHDDVTTGTSVVGHMLFAYKAPDRYRMEGMIPGMSSSGSDAGGIAVYDGSAVWMYLPDTKQYASIPATALTDDAPGDLGDLRPKLMDQFMMRRYRNASDFGQNAKFLRQEDIDFAGAKVNCYVLSVPQKQGGLVYTWWIDSTRYLILREDDAGSSTVYTSIKLNEPLPDSLFKFEPPPGSQKIEQH